MDLKLGIYYQKCHDPVCKAQNYKSPEQPVPPECLPAFFDEFDDDDLLAATEQAELMHNKSEVKATAVGAEDDDFNDDDLLAATRQAEETQAKVVKHVDLGVNGGAARGSTAARRCLSGDGGNASWQQLEDVGITDEEMLAAVSEMEDSGIEN